MQATYNANTGLDNSPKQQADTQVQDAIARAAVESRRFILSKNITPGLGYDDRLTARLGVSRTTVFKLIGEGKLKPTPIDGKIIVSERAIRRFEDGLGFSVENESSNLQAA